MLRFTTVSAAALLTASSTFAGPLKPDHVSQDARWLFHADVEGFVNSELGQCLLEHEAELDMEGVHELNEALGIDVLRDVLSLTIYGGRDEGRVAVDAGEDDGVVRLGVGGRAEQSAVAVVLMTEAADQVIERLKQDESYAEVRKDGYVLHSFVDRESDKRQNVYIQREDDRRLLVAGPKIEEVVHGIQVVSGNEPSIAKRGVLGDARPRSGSFMFATGVEVSGFSDDDPASQILGKSKQVSIDFGAAEGDAYASLAVTAKTQEDATNISQIMQGLVALGRMVLQNEPHAADAMTLLNAVRFDSKQDMIVARLTYPSAEACQMLLRAMRDHEHMHDVHDHLHDHLHGDDDDDHGHGEDDEHNHHHHGEGDA